MRILPILPLDALAGCNITAPPFRDQCLILIRALCYNHSRKSLQFSSQTKRKAVWTLDWHFSVELYVVSVVMKRAQAS